MNAVFSNGALSPGTATSGEAGSETQVFDSPLATLAAAVLGTILIVGCRVLLGIISMKSQRPH
jgi:type IV secretory pathway VirB10-like protein